MNKPLIDFYSGRGSDHDGRTLDQILSWPDDQLEQVHDYIQWVFPLQERSAYNRRAPILDAETILLFRATPRLQDQLRRSFRRILAFYGFSFTEADGEVSVVKADSFGAQSRYWLNEYDHNHLRITRILKCACLLGLRTHALALHRMLEELYVTHGDVIGDETLAYWREAVQ
ncbi:MAG: opioid growth factor receptor-related protein [Myxococcota bacterium]